MQLHNQGERKKKKIKEEKDHILQVYMMAWTFGLPPLNFLNTLCSKKNTHEQFFPRLHEWWVDLNDYSANFLCSNVASQYRHD